MSNAEAGMARRADRSSRTKDPWRSSPTSELQDQVLPRWFVLLALALVPIALGVLVTALVTSGPEEVPVEARRPPPAAGLSSQVGQVLVDSSPATAVEPACSLLSGVRVAGQATDPRHLQAGLSALCEADLPAAARDRVRRFADAGGTVRFAHFEAAGVDSVAVLDPDAVPALSSAVPPASSGEPAPSSADSVPAVLVNARYSQTDPRWIAPLLVHDLTLVELGPAEASAALAARSAEAAACDALLGPDTTAPGCRDARAVVGLADPEAALRAQGYR